MPCSPRCWFAVTLSVLRSCVSQMTQTRSKKKHQKATPVGIVLPGLPCVLLQANGLLSQIVELAGDGMYWMQTLDWDYDLEKSEIRLDKNDKPELVSFDPKVSK